MTKKDFELIASCLNYPKGLRITKEGLVLRFADTLASKNPRFNKEKFLQACGVEVYHKHDLSCYMTCMKKMF